VDPVPELRRRPFGVIVVALLQLGTVLLAIVSYVGNIQLPWEGALSELLVEHQWARVGLLLFGVLVVLAAIGMWRLRRWGWALMITLVGLSLALDITMWWRSAVEDRSIPLYLRMAFDVVSAFYLNSSAVQVAFREGSNPDPAHPETRSPAETTSSAGRIDP
jgi:hypothetical protein